MRFSGKFIGDFFLCFVFIQAFIVLCFEEQILRSTRFLGLLEDRAQQLDYQLSLKKMTLEENKSAYRILECAEQVGLTKPAVSTP